MEKLTLADIENMPEEVLTAEQVAPILGVNPHSIRLQANEDPYAFGFPVMVIGTRVKIPRRPFLNYMKGTESRQELEDIRSEISRLFSLLEGRLDHAV